MSFSSQISCNTLIIKIHSSCVGMRSTSDYSGFGVQLDGRTSESEGYRYGFQGQEKDDEIKGEGNSVNYTFRMHDPRVGRFFAVDPLTSKYPWYTPYSFSGNKVIAFVELEGKEELNATAVRDGVYSGEMQINLPDGNRVILWVSNNAIAMTHKDVSTLASFPNFANITGSESNWDRAMPGCGGRLNYFSTGIGGLSQRIEGESSTNLYLAKVKDITVPSVVTQNFGLPVPTSRSFTNDLDLSIIGGRNSPTNDRNSATSVIALNRQLAGITNNINTFLNNITPLVPAADGSCPPNQNNNAPITITLDITYNGNEMSDNGINAMNAGINNFVNNLTTANPNINVNVNLNNNQRTRRMIDTTQTAVNATVRQSTITNTVGPLPTEPNN